MELIEAAQTGNIELVRQLLDSGVDATIQNSYGETALIVASTGGNIRRRKTIT